MAQVMNRIGSAWLQSTLCRGVVAGGAGSYNHPLPEYIMNTEQIAQRLVELCRKGEYEQAQRELYAQNAVSIEMPGLPDGALGDVEGLEAIYEKGRQFSERVEAVHATEASDPMIAGNWFSVAFSMDMTFKGRGRVQMQEIGVYHVRDGKIDHEQFFYDM
jgi:hypothetical protein